MVGICILVFLLGCIFGMGMMALMAASKEPEPHEVHVYCDDDGNAQIRTFPVEDKVIWHKNEKKEEKETEGVT